MNARSGVQQALDKVESAIVFVEALANPNCDHAKTWEAVHKLLLETKEILKRQPK